MHWNCQLIDFWHIIVPIVLRCKEAPHLKQACTETSSYQEQLVVSVEGVSHKLSTWQNENIQYEGENAFRIILWTIHYARHCAISTLSASAVTWRRTRGHFDIGHMQGLTSLLENVMLHLFSLRAHCWCVRPSHFHSRAFWSCWCQAAVQPAVWVRRPMRGTNCQLSEANVPSLNTATPVASG